VPAWEDHLLIRASWRRHLLNALLLPAALVAVLLEDVIWAGARAVLRWVARLRAVRHLQARMARLPGWAALPLFVIPEGVAKVGEAWAVTLLVRRHVVSAVVVYALVRLASTLLAVFVYMACEPALLRMPWFAASVRWVLAVRDWSLAQLAPLRMRLHAAADEAPGEPVRRFTALRRWLDRRIAGWRARSARSRTKLRERSSTAIPARASPE
jgi:hypothetical protein